MTANRDSLTVTPDMLAMASTSSPSRRTRRSRLAVEVARARLADATARGVTQVMATNDVFAALRVAAMSRTSAVAVSARRRVS
jgi:hypothetical protein